MSPIPQTPEKTVDVLIVGQGLAGTLLADALQQAGLSFHVIDHRLPGAASPVAAGIINPVTGRRYVLSWRFDEFLPTAKKTYDRLEDQLGHAIFRPLPLIRAMFSARDENDWLARTADPEYQDYLSNTTDLGGYKGKVRPARGYGELLQSAQVDLQGLITSYRRLLLDKGALTEMTFDHRLLHRNAELLQFGHIKAKFLIFCEGHLSAQNPFFDHIPHEGDKGDALIVSFPDAHFDRMLKHKAFIVPLPNGQYWVGSTYLREFEDPGPTPEGRKYLEKRLKETLTTPYIVHQHLAAVRPSVTDRRPLLGRAPNDPRILIFNGFGTKGASLGPFWAQHLVEHLQGKTEIDPEVDIRRF